MSMESCNLGDLGAVSVAEGLARSKSLKSLNLRNNGAMDEAALAFAEALDRASVVLEVLDLSKNKISDVGGAFLAKTLERN